MMEKIRITNKTACFHCGENCGSDGIGFDDKSFCCIGCKAVYELLNQHHLGTYYSLENKPGIKTDLTKQDSNRFKYLDDDSIKQRLLEFNDGTTARVTFFIPQMHCSSCLWLLENIHRINDAVKSSQVIFLEKRLTVLYDETKLSLSELVFLLTKLGYEPTINLDNLEKKKPKYNHRLSLKMAVAGFSFANIMLFSVPEYFASEGELTSAFRYLFGYLNIFLALPVLLYSGNEYFISAYRGLRQKIINMDVPISLGIIILFLRSFYDVAVLNQAGYFDSFAGLVFFLLIGKSFQKRTYDSLSFDRDYKSFFPLSVTKIDKAIQKIIPITKLKIGDRLIVRNGELIPADSVLINGQGKIDYSFVTGESITAEKMPGDNLFAGGKQTGGAIEIETIKDVSQSYLTRLWNENVFKEKPENSFSNLANHVAKYFTAIIIGVALLTGLYWYFVNSSIAVNAVTAVLIVACPCALALSTPFTLGTVLRYFGRNKFYLKNSEIVENLARVNMIVFDKTGTLTTSSDSNIVFDGQQPSEYELQIVKSAVYHSSHPLSRKIYNYIKNDFRLFEVDKFNEIVGKGIETVVDSQSVKIGSPDWINNNIKTESNNKTRVAVAVNDKFIGEFIISNKYREGIDTAINDLKSGYTLAVLSGDNDSEKENLTNMFGEQAEIRFNCSPHDKLNYIDNLKKENKSVLMLGDGLNDAGALVKSNVGVAVSEDKALFTPASDAILQADSIKMLNKFVKLAKKSLTIIKGSFVISFIYNIIGLSFAVSGLLTPLFSAVLMPISSITVVLFSTLSVSYAAKKQGL